MASPMLRIEHLRDQRRLRPYANVAHAKREGQEVGQMLKGLPQVDPALGMTFSSPGARNSAMGSQCLPLLSLEH